MLLLLFFQKNIVHRDLKLGNMVLNKRSRRIVIANFCLGKHLVSECDPLKDQRGSPAYISPDVLSGETFTCLINRFCFTSIIYAYVIIIACFHMIAVCFGEFLSVVIVYAVFQCSYIFMRYSSVLFKALKLTEK